MGIINLGDYEWIWDKRGNSKRSINRIGLVATNTFLDNFRFKKANNSFKCFICEKDKPKNTRYLGDSYEKICCDCSFEWIENSKKELQKMTELLNKSKENLKLNKEKWRKEMILGALQ